MARELFQLANRLTSRCIPGWTKRDSTVAVSEPHIGSGRELPARVCIINFTGERKNWGCRATSWELVRLLNRHWPASGTFALDVIPLLPHHALDRDIPARHNPEIRAALTNPTPTDEQKALILEVTRTRYLQYVDTLRHADIVLFQAEGTMTGTDFVRAERLLLLPWIAKHVFGKTVISVNQTLFSADSNFSQMLFTVLDSLDQIWVREPMSLSWLQENGFNQARLVADTAFLTDPLPHGNVWKTLPDQDYFCVTGSAALAKDAIPQYLDTIRAIADSSGLFPVLVCSAGQDMMLPEVAGTLWADDSFCTIQPDLAYQAVADLLGKARFLIGGRYHMSILAAIGGTPSVLIETNSHKLRGLIELLRVNWPVRMIDQRDDLINDAHLLLKRLANTRPELKERVQEIRSDIVGDFEGWYRAQKGATHRRTATLAVQPQQAETFDGINRRIATSFRYPDADTLDAKLGPPRWLARELKDLTIYLRRGVHTEATFRCLRQLIEGNLDLVLSQLDSRWLISICDSYADFGDPVEARNALLISTFLNWERLAATYIHWAEPHRNTRRVEEDIPPKNEILWDGLVTIHLKRGDTTNNLFIRYARLLEPTPHLLRIWRTLLERIQNNDTVMAALAEPHTHIFDESLEHMMDEQFANEIPPWLRQQRYFPHKD